MALIKYDVCMYVWTDATVILVNSMGQSKKMFSSLPLPIHE